jgi:VWFA-related protein
MVTDASGRHVSDLKPEDFAILEDGKPQKITQFAFVNPGTPVTGPDIPPGSATTTSAQSRNLRRDEVHRIVVLLLDDLHTLPDDVASLAPVMKNFVSHQVAQGDLVSVMATRSGMGIYESLTNDKKKMDQAIDRLTGRAGNNIVQESDTEEAPGVPTSGGNRVLAATNEYFIELYHQMARSSGLSTACATFRGVRQLCSFQTVL